MHILKGKKKNQRNVRLVYKGLRPSKLPCYKGDRYCTSVLFNTCIFTNVYMYIVYYNVQGSTVAHLISMTCSHLYFNVLSLFYFVFPSFFFRFFSLFFCFLFLSGGGGAYAMFYCIFFHCVDFCTCIHVMYYMHTFVYVCVCLGV